MYEKKTLSLQDARNAVEAMIKKAEASGARISAAAVGEAGELIYFVRMDRTSYRTGRIAINKAYSAAVMRRDTAATMKYLEDHKRDLTWFGDPRETAVPGGVCIRADDGTVIGGVGVSGCKAEDKPNDLDLALVGAKAAFL